ncbi:MAG: ribonuclease III [Lachnospiraceae bacterium]|nr:ribonuclease III [Lachnospiraceae bacterium]
MAQKISEIASLNLAFLGDAVFELFLREEAVANHKGNVNALNKRTTEYSKAVTQAKIADILLGKQGGACMLDEEELAVFKRGRNAKGVSIPKSATPSEYRKATGLEALIGYLYLQKKTKRISQLITYGIEQYKESK